MWMPICFSFPKRAAPGASAYRTVPASQIPTNDFCRELGWIMEERASKIQEKWPRYDVHLQDAQLVILSDQLRDVETQMLLIPSSINCAYTSVSRNLRFQKTMRLDRRIAGFRLAYRRKDDTVNTEAQPLGQPKLVPRSEYLSILDQICSMISVSSNGGHSAK